MHDYGAWHAIWHRIWSIETEQRDHQREISSHDKRLDRLESKKKRRSGLPGAAALKEAALMISIGIIIGTMISNRDPAAVPELLKALIGGVTSALVGGKG